MPLRTGLLPRIGVVIAWLTLCAGRVHGHAQGETYIWLNVEPDHFAGTMQVRIPDLREHLGLEIPEDLEGARAAVQETLPLVAAYIRANVILTVDGRPVAIDVQSADALPAPRFGHFAAYTWRTDVLPMPMPDSVTLGSRLLFDADPRQRSLVCIEYDRIREVTYGEEYTAAILNPATPEATLAFDDVRSLVQLREIVRQGAAAWAEPRHGLFLLAMLLPLAVAGAGPKADAGVGGEATLPAASSPAGSNPRRVILRGSFGRLLAFSIPCGLAFAAAAAGLFTVAPSITAAVAAASIAVLSLAAVLGVAGPPAVGLVGLFGLFHGAAFAGMLLDLPFRMKDLLRAIILFGGGLGLVQLAVMAMTTLVLLLLAARPAGLRRFAVAAAVLGLVAGIALLAMPLIPSGGAG